MAVALSVTVLRRIDRAFDVLSTYHYSEVGEAIILFKSALQLHEYLLDATVFPDSQHT
jgi:hypothetical protein